MNDIRYNVNVIQKNNKNTGINGIKIPGELVLIMNLIESTSSFPLTGE